MHENSALQRVELSFTCHGEVLRVARKMALETTWKGRICILRKHCMPVPRKSRSAF